VKETAKTDRADRFVRVESYRIAKRIKSFDGELVEKLSFPILEEGGVETEEYRKALKRFGFARYLWKTNNMIV
jgi:hypothetical protein